MKVKILLIFLISSFVNICLCRVDAYALVKDDFSYSLNNNSVTITDYNSDDSMISIPEQIGGLYVTAIGSNAFENCSASYIFIPESVTVIGESAFYGCSNLKAISIPDGVKIIENNTFNGCKRLSNIVIPDSVNEIKYRAFYGCNSLTSAEIPNGVKILSNAVFQNCWSLENISIPNSVTEIEYNAFRNCGSLTKINIPQSVTVIHKDAFYYCSKLTDITLPDNVTMIGSGAFEHTGYYSNSDNWDNDVLYINNHLVDAKSNITGTYNIKDGTLTLSDGAFIGCHKLTDISIPESVRTIGSYTFSSCSGLTNISISKGVNTIADYAFKDCTGIKNVYVNANVKEIDETAFSGCINITSIIWNAECGDDFNWENNIFADLGNSEVGLELVIGDNVNTLPDFFFYECENLRKVTINSGVDIIGYSAFSNCANLTNVTISEGVTHIDKGAFSNCSGLTSISISDTVTEIGEYAFYKCSNLKEIYIGTNVINIGNNAFYNCCNIEHIYYNAISVENFTCYDSIFYFAGSACNGFNVTFGKDVEYIPEHLFDNCKNLKVISFSENLKNVGGFAFEGCENIERINISDLSNWCEINFLGQYSNPVLYTDKLYLNDELLTNLIVPDDVKNIGKSVFAGYKNLMSISIGKNVASIGDSAFKGCINLTSITIPENVASIGDSAFKGCINLTSITIPENVLSIGDYAFAGCTNINNINWDAINASEYIGVGIFDNAGSNTEGIKVTFGVNVNNIPENAFSYSAKPKIVTVLIGNNVVSIGDNAFAGCYNLSSITIPEKVKTIGNAAFANCINLSEINWNAVSAYSFSSKSNVFSSAGINGNGVSVKFGDNVNYIPSYLFSETDYTKVPKITTLTLGKNVQMIGFRAFANCIHLKSIKWNAKEVENFPEYYDDGYYEYYENYAFLNAGAQTDGIDVIFGDNVTHIPANAFFLTHLNNVTISDSVSTIGNGAFKVYSTIDRVNITDVASWCSIVFGSDQENTHPATNPLYCAEGLYLNGELIKDLNIPEGVISINSYAFMGYKALKSVTIPKTVTALGNFIFYNCTNLTNIIVDEDNPIYSSSDGNIYNKNKTVFMYYAPGKTEKICRLDENINTIYHYAFYNCMNITAISIPKSLVCIGTGAFFNCLNLKYVYFNGTLSDRQNMSIYKSNSEFENAQTIFLNNSKTATYSIADDNVISIMPVNIEKDNCIVCVCIKDNDIVFKKIYKYNGEKVLCIKPDEKYDTVNIMVFESLVNLKPLCVNEIIQI